jgi:4,5-DOPA dioxygenase extradiol
MTAQLLPALFISHGSPMLVFEDIPARDFIAGLGHRFERPKAILCISAHWETERPTVSAAAEPETIHDFYGFPDELYRLRYPAPGSPALARRTVELLKEAGIDAAMEGDRGLDHGAWNPLLLTYPQADVPVTQLSIQTDLDPAHHAKVGRALQPLRREGVLVLASGGAVHNLRQFHVDREQPAPWALSFETWLADRIVAGDDEALLDYRQQRPDGRLAHPRDEHLLPLFVTLGAGGGVAGRPLHRSFAHGSLSMAAFAWD